MTEGCSISSPRAGSCSNIRGDGPDAIWSRSTRRPLPRPGQRLTDNARWGSSCRRAVLNVQLAKQLRVDGAVHFNPLGLQTRTRLGARGAGSFMEAGIPFLPSMATPGREPAAGEIAAGHGACFLEML